MKQIAIPFTAAFLSVGIAFAAAPAFHTPPQPFRDYWALTLLPKTNAWVTIEHSADLETWSELVSIAGMKDAILYVDESKPSPSLRFYRVRSPGTRPDDARQQWEEEGIANYSFKLTEIHFGTDAGFLRTATIQVSDGVKTVSNVEVDNETVEEIDPADFPTIEELFDRLGQARAEGVQSVWVRYDAEQGFPVRMVIDDRTPMGPGEAVDYRVENLAPLP